MNIKKAIRLALAMADMTQKDLSIKSGLPSGHLSLIINEKRSMTLTTLSKIAKALNMKASELIALGEE